MIGDCVQAKVEAGIISEKETVLLMPQNIVASVRAIEQQGAKVAFVSAGTICDIGLKLPNDFDVNYLKKGTVICDPQYSIPLVKRFVARVVVYDLP